MNTIPKRQGGGKFFSKITNKSAQSNIISLRKGSFIIIFLSFISTLTQIHKYLKLNQCLYFGHVWLRIRGLIFGWITNGNEIKKLKRNCNRPHTWDFLINQKLNCLHYSFKIFYLQQLTKVNKKNTGWSRSITKLLPMKLWASHFTILGFNYKRKSLRLTI